MHYPGPDQAGLDAWGNFTASFCKGARPVVLIESLPASTQLRARALAVLFNRHRSPAALIVPAAVCALAACGVTSGIVVDVGHTAARVTIVLAGSIGSGVRVVRDSGGAASTAALHAALGRAAFTLPNAAAFKELCFAEGVRDDSVLTLGDGRELRPTPAHWEAVRAPLAGVAPALLALLAEVEAEQGAAAAAAAVETVVLCGGGASLSDVAQSLPRACESKIALSAWVVPPAGDDRTQLVWRGASLLASTAAIQTLWTTPAMLEEAGEAAVADRCPL